MIFFQNLNMNVILICIEVISIFICIEVFQKLFWYALIFSEIIWCLKNDFDMHRCFLNNTKWLWYNYWDKSKTHWFGHRIIPPSMFLYSLENYPCKGNDAWPRIGVEGDDQSSVVASVGTPGCKVQRITPIESFMTAVGGCILYYFFTEYLDVFAYDNTFQWYKPHVFNHFCIQWFMQKTNTIVFYSMYPVTQSRYDSEMQRLIFRVTPRLMIHNPTT